MGFADLPPRLVLERLVGELTQRQYDVFLMRVVEGKSFVKIGVCFGISRQVAMEHHSAALRKIGKIEWEVR